MPHTYLLDTRVWRAQDPEHGPQPGDLGLPLPVTGFTEVQGRRPPLGEGRLAPSHLLGTQRGTPWCTTPFLPTTRSGHCSQSHFSDGKTEAGKGSVPSDLAVDEGL